MKKTLLKKVALILLILGSNYNSSLFAQVAAKVPFTPREGSTHTIKGDVQMIANAIIGLDGFQPAGFIDNEDFDPNGSYNGESANDALKVGYIDIDGDNTTHSSSSAKFFAKGDCAKVVYAGLYWSATYYTTKLSNNYPKISGLPVIDDRPDFKTIKLKIPGGITYNDVTADDVIFDGWPNTTSNPHDSASNDVSYACYADVTDLISAESPNGYYTVANVKSTIGQTASYHGASAGWVLVMIYEDQTLSAKKISTQDGFMEISENANQEFLYENFETLEPPNPVKATYGVAALEGDYGISGDDLIIYQPDEVKTKTLKNNLGKEGNFFNSSISSFPTKEIKYNKNRNPKSQNTLGFDADIFKIDNPESKIIGNNQNRVKFKATSKGDRYRIFLNLFAIEVIRPVLKVKKTVINDKGDDITGQEVTLGQSISYKLTIENQGNEDITNATIRDVLPVNVDFEKVTVNKDKVDINLTPDKRQLIIKIPDVKIKKNSSQIVIQFEVKIVANCKELRDACSNIVENIAKATYTGVDSGYHVTEEESVKDQDKCGLDVPGTSNFLIGIDECGTAFKARICDNERVLKAGDDFKVYVWSKDGVVVGNKQEYTVTTPGVYRVDKKGNPDCQDLYEIWTVSLFKDTTNPIVDLIKNDEINGRVEQCVETKKDFPIIVLCGDEKIYLYPKFDDAISIEWQKLDTNTCPIEDKVKLNCPITDCESSWKTVAIANTYTVQNSGEYRIKAEFEKNCILYFSFRVVKNNFQPKLEVIKEIACGKGGELRVINAPIGVYQYQIKPPGGNFTDFQDSPSFTNLTIGGKYYLNVIEKNPLGSTKCTFKTDKYLPNYIPDIKINPIHPTCPKEKGKIEIIVNNGLGNYVYKIESTTSTYIEETKPTTVSNHTFEVNSDTYNIKVSSYDGRCIKEYENVVIKKPAEFTLVAKVKENLHCDKNDPDGLIALIELTTTGGSGDFLYDTTPPSKDKKGGNIVTYEVTAAETYTFKVVDLITNCVATSEPVKIEQYKRLKANATVENPKCPNKEGSITVTVEAGTGIPPYRYDLEGIEYSKETDDLTYTFDNVPFGKHRIRVLDKYGCELNPIINKEVTAPKVITAEAKITKDYTCLVKGEITVSNPQNGSVYEYSRDGGVTFVNNPVFKDLEDGVYIIMIRGANTKDCPVMIKEITIDPLQKVEKISFDNIKIECEKASLTVTATGTNGATSFEYRIIAPIGEETPYQTNPKFEGLEEGVTYVFEVRTTTDLCTKIQPYTIKEIVPITVEGITKLDPICNGEKNGSFLINVSKLEDTATYTYTITGGTIPIGAPIEGGPIAGSPFKKIDGLGGGTYTIKVIDEVTNCKAENTVILKDPSALKADTEKDLADCGEDTGIITVKASGGRGGYQYMLKNKLGVVVKDYSNKNIFGGLAKGTYTVFVKDGGGATPACEKSEVVILDGTVVPTLAVTGDDGFCYDGAVDNINVEITITSDPTLLAGPYTYTIDGNIPKDPKVTIPFTIKNLIPGDHTVIVKNTVTGCISTPLKLVIEPQLTLKTSFKDLDCSSTPDAKIELTVEGGYGGNTFEIKEGLKGYKLHTGGFPFLTKIPNTYQFKVTDKKGCVVESEQFVVNPAPDPKEPPSKNIIIKDVNCIGQSDGAVTFILDKLVGTPPFTMSFNGSLFTTETTYGGLKADKYEYIIKDAKQCIKEFEVIIGAPDPFTFDKNIESIKCGVSGDELGSITLTNIKGGTNDFTFQLKNPKGIVVAPTTISKDAAKYINLEYGDYTFSITDTNGCNEEFVFKIETKPEFTADINTFSTCGDGAKIDIEVDGGIGPFKIKIPGKAYVDLNSKPAPAEVNTHGNNIKHQINNDISSLGPLLFNHNYRVDILDTTTGCTYTQEVQTTPSKIAIAIVENEVKCNGDKNGSIDYTVSGYTSTELKYAVYKKNSAVDIIGSLTLTTANPEPGLPAGGSITRTISGFEPGEYVLNITESVGSIASSCNQSMEFEIREPTPLSIVEKSQTKGTCNELSTVTVNGQGGRLFVGGFYKYTAVLRGAIPPVDTDFKTGNVLHLDDLNGTQLGWVIHVMDANGCKEKIDVTISIIAKPVITDMPNFVNDECNFDYNYEFTVKATGASKLVFGIDDGDTSTNDIPVFYSGTSTSVPNEYTYIFKVYKPSVDQHTITVKDQLGCTVKGSIKIHKELLASAEFTKTPTCRTDDGEITIKVSGGSDFLINPDNFTFRLTKISPLPIPTIPDQSGSDANIFKNVAPGKYEIVVFDKGISGVIGGLGCDFGPIYVEIKDPKDPKVTLKHGDVSCNGGKDGYIRVTTPVGEDYPYTYKLYEDTTTGGGVQGALLKDQPNNPLFVDLEEGYYIVKVISGLSCTTDETVYVGQPQTVTATVKQTDYKCGVDNSSSYPEIIVTINGGTPKYDISYTGPGTITGGDFDVDDMDIAEPGVQYIFNAYVAGDYKITVKDSKNCTTTTIPTVKVPVFPKITGQKIVRDATALLNSGEISCDNPEAIIVSVDDDGSVDKDYKFEVIETGVEIDPIPGELEAKFTLPDVGNYSVKITDQRTGCYEYAYYEVKEYNLIAAKATTVTDVLCFGAKTGQAQLTITNYTGEYIYTVTESDSNATVAGPKTVDKTPILISNLPAGSLKITIEAVDTPFCDTVTNTFTIAGTTKVNAVVNRKSDETCDPGDDATITIVAGGGVGSYQYKLEKPIGTPYIPYGDKASFQDLDAGLYMAFIKDANKCEIQVPFTIDPPKDITVHSVSSKTSCYDSSDGTITATASGGQGVGSYYFSLEYPDGSKTDNIISNSDVHVFTGLRSGKYKTIVTDDLNCEATFNLVIDAPTRLMFSEKIIRPPSCTNPTADVEIIASGGTPPYEFKLNDKSYQVVTGVSYKVSNLIEGEYDFYVRDSRGCVAGPSNTIYVRKPLPLIVELDIDNTVIICYGQKSGSIRADEVRGGLGEYKYSVTGTDYEGNTINLGPQDSDSFTDLYAGDYQYSVTSKDCGPKTVPFTIKQPDKFDGQILTEDVTCNGEGDGRIIITAVGGVKDYVYSLIDSDNNDLYTFVEDGIDGVLEKHVFDNLRPDNYVVKIYDSKGCPIVLDNLTIKEPTAIYPRVEVETPETCAEYVDGTAKVTIAGGIPGYYWSLTGEDASYKPVADPDNFVIIDLPGGTSTLFIRDTNNKNKCEFALDIKIGEGVNLGAKLVKSFDCPIFDPASGNRSASPTYYVEFSHGIVNEKENIIYTLEGVNGTPDPDYNTNSTGKFEVNPGEYQGILLHEFGCEVSTDTIEIKGYEPLSMPVAQHTGNPNDPNEYEIIVSGGKEGYVFYAALNNGEKVQLESNKFSIRETGAYLLFVKDSNGCEIWQVQLLTYINIRIENYFTPNGDGTNDCWYPKQISPNPNDPFYFKNMEVNVFDRYGRLIKQFKGEQEGWDGIYQGSELPSGDYWYSILLHDVDNRQFSGHFTLYR